MQLILDTSLFMLIDRLSSSLIDVEALLRHPIESASPSTNEEKNNCSSVMTSVWCKTV